MSDTPRTDALLEVLRTKTDRSAVWDADDMRDMLRHAREMEREINALKHDLERAMKNHNADLNAPQGIQCKHGLAGPPAASAPVKK